MDKKLIKEAVIEMFKSGELQLDVGCGCIGDETFIEVELYNVTQDGVKISLAKDYDYIPVK
ncbi:hypothetical protein FJQ98_16090 [Lysinibacillus agricola]|uniref:Phage protein n=1 Tax=Lysinibacillus agricola TaxID=2590012 RepID=A0ABX7AMQ0_9BACI|nr:MULTISPECIES: hypothetical protein [Lysinibacillus]KOS61537.1 hypothetical protein AN161_18280 [Lysinibacillus sp. FJAT-14222]QQP10766.1 hypothetical protein FJQ98_16090 [Lysinibacillus agricola]